MTSKIVVNNIESDAGVSTVFFNSDIGATDGTLNVDGNLTVDGVITYEDVTNIDSVGIITANAGIHLDDVLSHKGNTNTKIRFPAADTITAETNGSERLRITSTGKIVTKGGTAVGALTLAGDGEDITFGRTQNSGTGGVGRLVATGNIVYIQAGANASSGSAADLVFGAYGGVGEKLRITSAGNIGVGGLTTPGALLSIPAGESNTPRFAIESAVDDNDFTITQYEDGNGTYTMLGQNVKLNSGGNVTVLDSGHRTAGMQLDARNHGAITFVTGAANAATERLHLNSDGKLILSGTARTSPFIVGDGGMCIEQTYDGLLKALSLRNKDTDAAAATALSFSLNRSGGDQDFEAGEIKLVKEQAWTTTSSTVDGAMVFSTISNGTLAERLRIKSDGSVGIGDNDPSDALTVYRSNVGNPTGITIRNTEASSTYSHARLRLESQNGAAYGHIWADVANSALRIAYNSSSSVNIKSTGDVGIGVGSPEAKLHVEENLSHSSTYYLNVDAHILVDNPGSGRSVLKLEGEAAFVYGGGGSNLLIADRQNERIRINEYGNTIFQGPTSTSSGNAGNAGVLIRGKTVSGSSTTVDLNISQATSNNGIGLEIYESSNNANALATLVFNHGSLKSMIACSRIATSNWGTDLRFYTHNTSTNSSNQHKVYERMRIDSDGRIFFRGLLGNAASGSNVKYNNSDDELRYDLSLIHI